MLLWGPFLFQFLFALFWLGHYKFRVILTVSSNIKCETLGCLFEKREIKFASISLNNMVSSYIIDNEYHTCMCSRDRTSHKWICLSKPPVAKYRPSELTASASTCWLLFLDRGALAWCETNTFSVGHKYFSLFPVSTSQWRITPSLDAENPLSLSFDRATAVTGCRCLAINLNPSCRPGGNTLQIAMPCHIHEVKKILLH